MINDPAAIKQTDGFFFRAIVANRRNFFAFENRDNSQQEIRESFAALLGPDTFMFVYDPIRLNRSFFFCVLSEVSCANVRIFCDIGSFSLIN